jgi:hypothetical protein
MSNVRTPQQKADDARAVFLLLRDEVTPPIMRELLDSMTNAASQSAAQVGDVQAYAALVQASLQLQRVIAANDRTVMVAAAVLTASGVSRPMLDTGDEA